MIFDDEMRRNPFPLFERLRSTFPVFREPESGAWMVFDHDSVKRVLQDPETFSSVVSEPEAKTSQWLIFTDPTRHTQLRGLVSRAFTTRAVAGLEPRIRALSRELLAQVSASGEMDLVADYALPLPMMVIAELLGAPIVDYRHFRRWSDTLLGLAHVVQGGDAAAPAIAAFALAHDEMDTYLATLLDQRRTTPTEDLLTRLLHAEVDGIRLSHDEILGFFQLLLLAGHETTTNLISNAVLCLLAAPDTLATVRARPELVPSMIEEVLRFRSPVQAVFRVTHREVVLKGQRIGPGELILPSIGAANRDPAVFRDPNTFDVTRDPNPHLAFGYGIHFCVGAPLARLEARIALPDLLALRGLARATEAPWEPRAGFNIHGPSRLGLRFEPS